MFLGPIRQPFHTGSVGNQVMGSLAQWWQQESILSVRAESRGRGSRSKVKGHKWVSETNV